MSEANPRYRVKLGEIAPLEGPGGGAWPPPVEAWVTIGWEQGDETVVVEARVTAVEPLVEPLEPYL